MGQFPADAGWMLGVFVSAGLLAIEISMLLVAYGGRTAETAAATPM